LASQISLSKLFPDDIAENLENCRYLVFGCATLIKVSDQFAFLPKEVAQAIILFTRSLVRRHRGADGNLVAHTGDIQIYCL
jgi:hypothetical protein